MKRKETLSAHCSGELGGGNGKERDKRPGERQTQVTQGRTESANPAKK